MSKSKKKPAKKPAKKKPKKNPSKFTTRVTKEGGRWFAVITGPTGEFETEHKTKAEAEAAIKKRLKALEAPRKKNPTKKRRGFKPPAEAVNCGNTVDVMLADGQLYSWSPRPVLNWAKMNGKDVLYWVDGEKPSRRRRDVEDVGEKTLAKAGRWLHRKADGYREISVPEAPLERVGVAEFIGYRSNKFRGRTMKTYQHDFTSSPVLYRGRAGAKSVFVLRGGRLRVTSQGIEG